MTGLVGWWPLHRTVGDAVDLSGEGNDGTITGPTRGVAGRGGLQAFSFDGSDDRIAVPFPSLGSKLANGYVTFNWWVRTTETSVTVPLGTIDDSTSNALQFFYNRDSSASQSSGYFYCFIRDDSGSNQFEFATSNDVGFNDGSWHMLTTVVEPSSQTASIYVDGSSVSVSIGTNTSDTAPADFQFDVGIGARNLRGTFDFFTDSIMSNFRIYDRALSANEIEALYDWGAGDYAQPPSDVDDTNAVAYWTLDEDPANTSTATDSWRSNDGTITGATQADPAIRGTGLSFDGTDDFVNIPDSFSLDRGGPLTLSAWVRPTGSTDSFPKIVGKEGSDPPSGQANYMFQSNTSTNDNVVFRVTDNSDGTNYDVTLAEPWTKYNNTWVHLTGVYDGTELRGYRNGELVGTNNAGSFIPDLSNNPAFIGTFPTAKDNFFAGQIDDVRLYSRALSPAEIHDVYRYGTFGQDLRKKTVNST